MKYFEKELQRLDAEQRLLDEERRLLKRKREELKVESKKPRRLTDDIKDDITCCICYDIFDKPRCLVPCSHLLCERCLHSLKQSSHTQQKKPKCPECRQTIRLDIDAPPPLKNIIMEYVKQNE